MIMGMPLTTRDALFRFINALDISRALPSINLFPCIFWCAAAFIFSQPQRIYPS